MSTVKISQTGTPNEVGAVAATFTIDRDTETLCHNLLLKHR
ncbi:hypothetical protein [Dapis sp. BLCC M229]